MTVTLSTGAALRDHVRAATRVVRILEVLSEQGRPVPASVLLRHAEVPRSTLYELLAALRQREFVSYEPESRRWSLGPRAYAVMSAAPTIEQAVLVLEVFDRQRPRRTLAELAQWSGLDIDQTARVVDALERGRFISKATRSTYELGLRLVRLATRIEPIERLRFVAQPFLVALRDRTGETANLLVRDAASVLYLDQVESRRALRVTGWTGRSVPLDTTASGAALTSDGGVHVVSDAVEDGITAIAARIPGADDPPVAVSVTGPSLRLNDTLVSVVRSEVAETAAAVGRAWEAELRGLDAPANRV